MKTSNTILKFNRFTSRLFSMLLFFSIVIGVSSCHKTKEEEKYPDNGINETYIYIPTSDANIKVSGSSNYPRYSFAFTSDSKKVYYFANRKLYIMNLDGSDVSEVIGQLDADQISISPDLTSLAYTKDNNLYVMGINGKNNRKLTNGSNLFYECKWSPDSKSILCSANDGLYLVSLEGKIDCIVTSTSGIYAKDWLFDSKNIVYTKSGQVFIYNLSSMQSMAITSEGLIYYDLSCSPNSQELLATCSDANVLKIVRMNADGTNLRTIMQGENLNSPKWSSDGLRLSYTLNSSQAIANIDGSNSHVINPQFGCYLFSTWSKDGKYLIYSRFVGYN